MVMAKLLGGFRTQRQSHWLGYIHSHGPGLGSKAKVQGIRNEGLSPRKGSRAIHIYIYIYIYVYMYKVLGKAH